MSRRRLQRVSGRRRGTASLEAIMILAVMMPVAATVFWISVRLFKLFHFILNVVLTWPLF